MRPGTRVSPVRDFCDSVFRDQHGNAIAGLEPQFHETTGKLGIFWYNEDGTVMQFHDDFW